MSNYFDRFDPKPEADSGNPFDKFDAPVARRPQAAAGMSSAYRMAAKPKPQERTWGQAIGDAGAGVMSGLAGLVKTAGQLQGLTIGQPDNFVTRLGDEAQTQWRDMQSDALKAKRQARSEKIDQADGFFEQAGAAIKETVTDPALLTDLVAENITSLIPVGGAAQLGAKAGAKVAVQGAARLGKEATQEAVARAAGRWGTGAAIGTGAAMQGANVGGETYADLMQAGDEVWQGNAEYARRVAAGEDAAKVKHEMALSAARMAGAGAAGLSVATQALPGAATIERALAGRVSGASGIAGRALNAAKGLGGEGLQEALEEGGGQFIGNYAKRPVANTPLMEGVGESAGLGFVAGGAMGGAIGALQNTGGQQRIASRPVPEAAPEEVNGMKLLAAPNGETPYGVNIVTPSGEVITPEMRGEDPRVTGEPASPVPNPDAVPGVRVHENSLRPQAGVPNPDAVPGSLSDAANAVAAVRTAARPVPQVSSRHDQVSELDKSLGLHEIGEAVRLRHPDALGSVGIGTDAHARPEAGKESMFGRMLREQAEAKRRAEAEQAGAEAPAKDLDQQGQNFSREGELARAALPSVLPWVNAETGEIRNPSDTELRNVMHGFMNRLQESGLGMRKTFMFNNLREMDGRLTGARLSAAYKEVQAERKRGLTQAEESQPQAGGSLAAQSDISGHPIGKAADEAATTAAATGGEMLSQQPESNPETPEMTGSLLSGEANPQAPQGMQGEEPVKHSETGQGEAKAEAAVPMQSERDFSHLNALERRMHNERQRLANANTSQERIAREVIVRGVEKEVQQERESLGLPSESHPSPVEMDADAIAAALDEGKGAETVPAAEGGVGRDERIAIATKAFRDTYLKAHGSTRALSDATYEKEVQAIARLVAEKDADGLLRLNIQDAKANPAIRAAFTALTGVKLPKGISATAEAIDAWAGVAKEERVRREQVKKAKATLERGKAVAGAPIDDVQVSGGVEGETGRQWVDRLISEGYDRLETRGKKSYLVNASGEGFDLQRAVVSGYAREALARREAQKIVDEDASSQKEESGSDERSKAISTPATEAAPQDVKFADNKLFTADKVQAARDRMRKKLGQLNSGIDPELLVDGMVIAGAYIESGVRKFSDYAQAMIADMGEGVKPYLLSFWEGARNFPGLDTEGMTSVEESAKLHQALMTPAARLNKMAGAIITQQQQTAKANNARAVPTQSVPAGAAAEDEAASAHRNHDRKSLDAGLAETGASPDRQRGVSAGADGTVEAGGGSLRRSAGERAVSPSGQARDRAGTGDGAVSADAGRRGRTGGRGRVSAGGADPATAEVSPLPVLDAPVEDDHAIEADEIGKGGLRQKYKDNIEAIRILKAMRAEGRKATSDERKQLAKYVGWGALKGVFDKDNKQWGKEYAELRDLLTDTEYVAARASVLNAHFTSPEVVNGIYSALTRLGFTGGRVLEPSVGVGNFFGLMPAKMRKASQLHGVELDPLTSQIAAALYPSAQVAQATGFQDYDIPGGYFDLAIGNPPFGNEPIVDNVRSPYSGHSIHNYFFAKSIDKLRPGGLLAMVVSHNFLDARNAKTREWIAKHADLVSAVRLPNTAFKGNAGTEVVTDILIFRKREPGQEPTNTDWVNTGTQTLVGKNGAESAHTVGQYFIANPGNVLGNPTSAGSMYRANEYTVEPSGQLKTQISDWVETLPTGIYTSVAREKEAEIVAAEIPKGVREGNYFVSVDGRVKIRTPDVMGRMQAAVWEAPNAKAEQRMRGMIGIRYALRQQMRLERSVEATEAEIDDNRAKLNALYDAFRADYGFLNDQVNRRIFIDDVEAPLVQALEFDYDRGISKATADKEGGEARPPKATKADIFNGRVLFPPQDTVNVSDAQSALLASLNHRGKLDMDYIAKVYDKPADAVLKELGEVVFVDPIAGPVLADEYLSGDVKTKLEEAEAAALDNPDFKRNVEALKKVIPADKRPSEIHAGLGASFVPVEDMVAFVRHVTGGDAVLKHLAATGQWLVSFEGEADAALNTGQWGTPKMSARSIFEATLAGRGVTVTETIRNPDGSTTTRVLERETEAAREKQAAMKEEWQRWLWSDPDRAANIAAIYNQRHNRVVPRKYDGSHMTFPGMSPAMELLPHQKNAVWRALQSRQVLLDHVVGAGKTFEIVAMFMEMRRLGIARKPIIAVPNHLTLQWRSEFSRLYPAANVLAAAPEDFAKDRREKFFSKVITGDWDAVIVGHSSLKKIALPESAENAVLNEQVQEISAAIEATKRERGDRNIIRDMENIKKRLEAKLKLRAERLGERDKTVDFADLGVDAFAVDELHEFKNLFYNTAMDRVPGMGNPTGSDKAYDLFVKLRWMFDTYGEKAPIIGATGTPVSNSLVEMFNLQRYLQYPTLKAQGMHVFDNWARFFAGVESVYEVAPSGTGYRQSVRMGKFKNMPALMQGGYQMFADTVTLEQLKAQEEARGKIFPVPKVAGGRPVNVVAQRSPRVAGFMGIPALAQDDSGRVRFKFNPESGDTAEILKNKDAWLVEVVHSAENGGHRALLGRADTQEDARLILVEAALTPEIKIDPQSILGQFDNLRELNKSSKGKINALSLTGQANKAGLDYRMIDPAAPDFPGSKINLAVERMLQVYHKWADDKGTQLVFCDLSTPKSARSSFANKDHRLYVKKDGELTHKRGTMHTVRNHEEMPFFVVKEGKTFTIYDAVSGVEIRRNIESKQEAKTRAAELLENEATRQRWIDARENAGEIEQQTIDDYNNTHELETDGVLSIGLMDIAGVSGAQGFSVYDDIKAKLIAAGVPAREIAFIHDFDTPTAKDKLFKAVNEGSVRFLLGSTQKMGAGTNVQKRLVGLHHIDAPWRPSDLEQREGRIIRRGNALYERDPTGFQVEIFRYATEQTYDTRRWQLLEHKARGIEQLRNYDGTVNEVEDIDGEASNAADMKAAASGDPLILEETRLRNEVKRLESLQAAHADTAATLAHQAKRKADFAGTIGPRELEQRQQLADEAKRHPVPKEGFAGIRVEGKAISDRKAATRAIKDSISRVFLVGGMASFRFRGVDFTLERSGSHVELHTPTGMIGDWLVNTSSLPSESGFITRMGNYVDRLPALVEQKQQQIKEAARDAKALRAQAGRPFEQAEALSEARQAHKRVQRTLIAKGPSIPETQKPMLAKAMAAQRAWLQANGYSEALAEFGGANADALESVERSTRQTYEARIDALFNGAKGNRQGVRILDRADMLDLLGYGDKSLHLKESAVGKLDRDGQVKHPGMTAEMWKRLPDWIENPVAVYRSQTVPGALVMFAPELVAGRPVRITLEPNEGMAGLDVHVLSNAYEEGGTHITPVDKWTAKGDLLYLDQKRSPTFNERSGLRLPRDVRQLRGYKHRVQTEADLRNYRDATDILQDDNIRESYERFLQQQEANAARQRLDTASGERSRLEGERLADELGLREAVEKVTASANIRVYYAADFDGLRGLVTEEYLERYQRNKLEGRSRGQAAGLYVQGYNTVDGQPLVVLYPNVVNTPTLAAFTAAHEVAGHHGLRKLLGKDLDKALEIANQNPTVKAVARSMMRQRNLTPKQRLLAIEEALADLQGAIRTGNFDRIEQKHGVKVPEGMKRDTLRKAIANFLKRLKEIFTRRGVAFSDTQVRQLLDAAWQAAQEDGVQAQQDTRAALESTEDKGDRNAQAEYKATERAYGGRTAYDKAKADGRTKLTYGQWVQVRTPAFKRWFGDWEAVQHREFLDGKPVTALTGDEFKPDGVPLTEKVPKWYAEQGVSTVAVAGIGDVALDVAAVKNSMSHGIGRDKATAFAAVPDVLRNGRIIHREAMRGSRDMGTVYHVAAPIEITGKAFVMDVLVKSDANTSRMYVHEVVLKEKLHDSAFKTGADAAEAGVRAGAESGAIRSVLQGIYAVNPASVSKVTDPETGEPLVVYHGTDADFSVFDGGRSNSKSNTGVPEGVFFFTDSHEFASSYTVGYQGDFTTSYLNGGNVMPVFLNIRKPMKVNAKGENWSDIVHKGEWYTTNELADIAKQDSKKDGLIVSRVRDKGRGNVEAKHATTFAAFRPNQIKSATGNSGNFDPNEDSILEAVEPDAQPVKPSSKRMRSKPNEALADIEASVREVMEMAEGKRSGPLLERAREKLADMTPGKVKDALRSAWLGALTLRHLTELGRDYFPTIGIYDDYRSRMAAHRNRLQQEANDVAEKVRDWAGKHVKDAKALFDLMHDATIDGNDPAEEYQPLQFRYGGQLHEVNQKNVRAARKAIKQQMRDRSGDSKQDMLDELKALGHMLKAENRRKKSYPAMRKRWEALSPAAQQHYITMRDMYKARSEETEAALIARINDLNVENAGRKRVLINKIRQQFESQRLQGVYFPLQRYGQYFVAAEKAGRSTFLMFDNLNKAERAAKGLRAQGFTITASGKKGEGKASDAPSGTFVAEVIEALRESKVSEATQDKIYQMYLEALPELSMRKHSIHRKAVPGFDPDAVRAFAHNMQHGAHQIARMHYAHKMSDTLRVLREQQEHKRRQPDADVRQVAAGDALLGELEKRDAWINNPQDSALTNVVSSFGFVYYLGASPAAALVNLTQTPLITYPYLAARYGATKAGRALAYAMKETTRTLGNVQSKLDDPQEVAALQRLQEMGALDKTQAHSLAGIAEGGLLGDNPKWRKAMEVIGFGFHKTEIMNREATGLATFRLARSTGASFDEAVQAASDAIFQTHYDYSNENRARFMQPGWAKVLLMFRQYSLNTTWHLARMVWQASQAADLETRQLARRNLVGILGMSTIFSGAMGLPMLKLVMGVLSSVAAVFGDDDEPWDAETEFAAFLSDMLGRDAARLVLHGAANAITGADIAGRVGLGELWFRDADRELDGRGEYFHLLEQVAGPVGGVLKNYFAGKSMIEEGKYWRGIETMLPKGLKDAFKSARYATEGANTLRGDPVIPDVSIRQILLQLGGFTPDQVSEQYDTNNKLKNYEQYVRNRRQDLMNAIAISIQQKDLSTRARIVEKIKAFNRKYPEIAIDERAIRQSLMARARHSQNAEGGILLNQKLAPRIRDAVGV